MFKRLLITTNFEDGLQRLIHVVPSLAATGVQQVTFLHCVPLKQDAWVPKVDKERMVAAQEKLKPAIEQVPAGIDVKVVIEAGQPIDDILRVAKEEQADLILTGHRVQNRLSEQVFGSTTLGLFERTPIPLMSFRPWHLSVYTREELDLRCRHLFHHLLVAYNGSDTSHYLIEQLKHYASQRSELSLATCRLCWVVDDAARREVPIEHRLAQAEAALVKVKADLEQTLELQVLTEVRRGSPLTELWHTASMADVSAIVVASLDRGALINAGSPSLTLEILRNSWFPVIFLPPKR